MTHTTHAGRFTPADIEVADLVTATITVQPLMVSRTAATYTGCRGCEADGVPVDAATWTIAYADLTAYAEGGRIRGHAEQTWVCDGHLPATMEAVRDTYAGAMNRRRRLLGA